MNEIFMWMWLADLSSAAGVVAIISLIAVYGFLSYGFGLRTRLLNSEDEIKANRPASNWLIKTGFILLIPAILCGSMPSKQTLHLLAAAKAGEMALQTETGSKALQAVNAILDDIITKHTRKEK